MKNYNELMNPPEENQLSDASVDAIRAILFDASLREVEEIRSMPTSMPISTYLRDHEKLDGDLKLEPIEFGVEDEGIQNPFQEKNFLFILKTLPKDRYRIIALLLFIKEELGWEINYKDMAGVLGVHNSRVTRIIERIQQVCVKNNLSPYTRKS